jgi:mannose-1-phosphate guanylyltransferase
MRLHAVILAGGRGERFWPLSRRDRPKQLLPLLGGQSLLQETASRLEGWIDPGALWVVASPPLMREVRIQLGGALSEACAIVEPVPRNTAAAIGVAAAEIEARDPGAIMLVLPSDHWIPETDVFRADVERVAEVAASRGGLHLFGVPISWPSTGYGYIEEGTGLSGVAGVSRAARFHEKPDASKALEYARDARMLWNAGIFVWRAREILDAIAQHAPALGARLAELRTILESRRADSEEAMACLERTFREAPAEPIDTLVLERHAESYVSRARFRWSDIGSWLAWGDLTEADPAGNRVRGSILALDTNDSVLYAEEGLLALLGVRDLIVVRLPDVTLVCSKERAQDLRSLLEEIRSRKELHGFL